MARELLRSTGELGFSPMRELARMEREMEDLYSRFFGDRSRFTEGGRGHAPAVDVIDKKKEIVLKADLPGLEEKDIEVMLENGTLTIRGKRAEEQETKDEDFYRCERWAGSFLRSLQLPPGVDTSKIDAKFRHGVLEVHVPKTKEATGRKVRVKGQR
jgi:HSP20 family protein